jgi:hypothetical protein
MRWRRINTLGVGFQTIPDKIQNKYAQAVPENDEPGSLSAGFFQVLVATTNCLGDFRAVICLACHSLGGTPVTIAIVVTLFGRTKGNAAVADHDTRPMMMTIPVVVAIVVPIVAGALTGDKNVVSQGG